MPPILGTILRIAFIGTAFFLAIKFAFDGVWLGTLGCVIALVVFFFGQIKQGRVYLAWLHVSRQNFDKAEATLDRIKNPEKLEGNQKAYYHLTRGVLHLTKQRLDQAERSLKISLDTGLRTENDQALVYLQLAGIEMGRGNKKKATEYIEKTKSLKHHKALDAEIIKLEGMLKQAQKQQRQNQFGHGRGGRSRFK